MQPQQHRQVDLSRGLIPAGQTLLPGVTPGITKHLPFAITEPFDDRLDQLLGLIKTGNGLQMKVQITRLCSTNADGVNPRIRETKQIVEHDRMQRRTQLNHLR